MAISVVVAVEPVADELIARISEKMATIKVGDGRRSCDMGPLVTKEHRDKVAGYIDIAVADGAKVVVDGRDVKADGDDAGFRDKLELLGETPLPRYIKRTPDERDKERYQTVFAKYEGAVAAPTAGMHFSRELIKRLEIKGIRFAEATLHTGLGTFRQIEVEDLSKHKMDAEYFKVDDYACKVVNRGIEEKRKVCSIGTTTLRALESSVTAQGLLKPTEGWTNLFIHPPHDFSINNSLVTNFHLPKTSLMIMTCAFAGYDLTMEAYHTAIKEKYRFFSYGDALLII
jgi:S-adenosylmethionine:tRNA ribosyltransferase-isomerase